MKHKRGALITDPQEIIDAIIQGKSLMCVSAVLSNPKIRYMPFGQLLDRMKEKKLYKVIPEVSPAVSRWIDIEKHLVLEAG